MYLASIMDLYSRKIVGWQMSDRMSKSLVLDALDQAYRRQRPTSEVLHHSDRGSQYTSLDYQNRIDRTSRKGNCYDNACIESFVEEFNKRAKDDHHSKGKWTRSYMDTSLFGDSDMNDLYTALSAAHFTNPEMLQRLQDEYCIIQDKIENDEIDPVRSTIVRLAIDGLWFAEMFG
ncbi:MULTISPECIES: DDE-type integrase/transposase/recombinase [unclassified Paenibacillus]|uniref:DDE-type integrase/transposase/recombinase n=1 Tax=unclassified Paenibacillus TaxID=185978 RepID=UPI003627B49F